LDSGLSYVETKKPNDNKEWRGKQAFLRNISGRKTSLLVSGIKSTIITLIKRLSKVIITLKPEDRKVASIAKATNDCSEIF
jgi:transposase, IS30 family